MRKVTLRHLYSAFSPRSRSDPYLIDHLHCLYSKARHGRKRFLGLRRELTVDDGLAEALRRLLD